jgi:calcineurin-like phosphoesterase family protein/PASTA domain-containing protein/Big-like domain-containing protein
VGVTAALVAAALVAALAGSAPAAAPSNDDFRFAQTISGAGGSVAGDNTEASAEAFEPWHAGSTAGASAWYRWTAPFTGDVAFDTLQASFDTVLAVYTGGGYPLTRVAENDDAWSEERTSRVHFRASAGTAYSIAVDGRNAAIDRTQTGAFVLRWARVDRPAHDDFASPRVLSGPSGSLDGSNVGATNEPDERDAGYRGGHSVWYRFDAPANGTLDVTVSGEFRPLLAAWDSDPYGPYRRASDLDPAGTRKAHIALTTVSGGTYRIGVDGYGGAEGAFTLEWRWTSAVRRHSNDDWDRAEVLPGLTGEIRTTTFGATPEPCEPWKGEHSGYASIWYRLTVPYAGSLVVETTGSRFDTVVSVAPDKYDCSSRDGLPADDDSGGGLTSKMTVTADHGRTYFISVSGGVYDTGAVVLRWRLTAARKPANDDLASAKQLAGRTGLVSFETNAGASKEAGEPAHAGVAGGRSVWYRWTAPAGGPAAFRLTDTTYPFGFSPVLAAYTGASVSALSLVASNDDWREERQSRISFTAVAGTTYWIAVDGKDGREAEAAFTWSQGGFALRWNSGPPPANDAFASARVVSGDSGSEQHTTIGATREPGEPWHWNAQDGGASVWFRWTAPVAGNVTFGIHSTSELMGLNAALYRGASLPSLELLDSDESFFEDTYVSTPVREGETVYVAVEGPAETTADFTFDWTSTPINDSFAAAIAVSGSSGTVTDSLNAATREQLEPTHGAASIWYRWTAPSSGLVTFDSCGSAGSSAGLAVYTGTGLGALQPIAGEGVSCDRGEKVFFTARAGTTYHVAALGSGVGLRLDWSYGAPTLSLVHDALANARFFSRDGGIDRALNVGATKEAGEPSHAGDAGGKSVWYRFEAIEAGEMTLDTAGSGFDTLLAAYRMPKNVPVTMANLQLLAASDDTGGGTASRVVFRTAPNELYYIALDGKHGESGSYVLSGRFHAVPGNDDVPYGRVLGGARTGHTTGDSTLATRQAGEPQHAGAAGGRSIWYRWQPYESGPVVFDTAGSSFDTLLAAYTGAELRQMTPVASNDDDETRQTSRIAFHALAGTEYWIAVDGKAGAGGHVRLNLGGANPANDFFRDAETISGVTGSVAGTTVGATREEGEECCVSSPSIWYRWTAPSSQVAIFDTRGTAVGADTWLYVYLGDRLGSLETVTEDDNSGPDRTSRATFPAVAGRTYVIKVQTWNVGAVRLNWHGPDVSPPSVRLEVPVDGAVIGDPIDVVADASDDHDVDLVDFMLDGSVVERACNCVRKPKFTEMWFADFSPDGTYSMTARAHDVHGHRTTSAPHRVTLDHRWPLIRLVGDLPPRRTASRSATISFAGDEPALTYTCTLDGVQSSCASPQSFSGLADGVHTFQVRAEDRAGNRSDWAAHSWLVTSAPANDLVAGATDLSGTSGSLTTSNATATLEQGEPLHARNIGGASLWYRLQASGAGPVELSTAGSSFDTLLAVYSGSASALTPVAANDDAAARDRTSSVRFDASSGTTYFVAVDGFDGATGSFRLAWGPSVSTPDTSPPDTTLESGPSGTMSSRNASFTFSATEPGSTFECSLDAAAFTACSSPRAYSSLTPGVHTFAVRAVDAAGNRDGSPASRTWTVVGDPILLAAGDIAGCDSQGDEATAAILDGYPDATVAIPGDLAYPDGSAANFANCYEPSWGRHKARTSPTPGNHEYHTPGATPYFDYFGAAAGDRGKGWYSYELGDWRVIALNSNCAVVACGPGSEQEQWLRAVLAASEAQCTLAYWHHPLFTSGSHAGESDLELVRPFWRALYDYGAELVLVGHDHDYERFAPQRPDGARDDSFGIRQFVVGTGGHSLRTFKTTHPNSEVRDSSAFGVLRLILRSGGYDWQFLPEAGKTFTDSGSTSCHAAPDGTAASNPTLSSSHPPGWSPDRMVDVTWSGASDGGSGVDGFSYEWSQSATTTPDMTKEAEETATGTTSPSLADGEWWFHLRTRDNAGNWSSATHLGPFRIDGTAATNPVPSSTHGVGVWSNDGTVDVTWSGAADSGSGVDGFSYAWTQSADTTPGVVKEAEEGATRATSPTLADGDWWFHLRTVDNAGNWSDAVHRGPFRIDTTAPANPTVASPNHSPGEWSNDPTVDVTWSGAADGGSGVDGFSYAWTQSAGDAPDDTKDAEETATGTTSSALADGEWWFHLRTVDNLGHWSAAVRRGPFRIDTTAPTNPTLSSPSHAVGAWSREETVVVMWQSPTNADGYSYEWSQTAATTPDQVEDVEETTTSVESAQPDGSWWFHLRTVDTTGAWSRPTHLGPFLIDTTAPAAPTLSSPSHPVGTWSNDATIEVTWSPAADAGSGVDGFSYAWTQSPSTTPDAMSEADETAMATTSAGLADGDWWFHLRTVDKLGHWSDAVHRGPFRIDTTAPTVPGASSSSHTPGAPSSDRTVDVAWSAQDAMSQVAGYSLLWSLDPFAAPDALADTTQTSATSPELADGAWWFHVRARDGAGNWGAPAHLGPFRIETPAEVPPTPPLEVSPPVPPPEPPPPVAPLPPEPPTTGSTASCIVPRLAGRTLKQARTLLARRGCRLGRVSRVYSRSVPKGRIVAQRPRPRASFKQSVRVNLALSLGRPPRSR